MASFDFLIPLSLDALQESTSTRQYVVTNISGSREIPKKVQEAQVIFRQDGPNFILREQCFDGLYSVLVNFASVDVEVQYRTWDLMVKAMGRLTAELGQKLDNDLTVHEKHKLLNVVKMTTYIACNLTEAFENAYNKPSTETLEIGKGRKKTVKGAGEVGDWEEDRNSMLVQLFSVLQYPLQRLWDPPIVEEDYVNLIANCCYKMLESPNMSLVRTKSTRASLFQIIGSLVKRFNHGLGCSLKLIQLLQHFEHMVTPAAQGVIQLIQDFGNKSVLSEIIREIFKVDINSLTKDTSSLRNFTQFLVEVSTSCPQVVVPSLSLLVNFLDEEVYSMRNCVLSILGSVVLKVLSGDDLDPKSKDLRDQCLDHLEDHIHDVTAFVRSKVLQIWNDLIREKAVPLRRQHHVLELVLGRLWDKSSMVRKHAMQLLTAFVNSNPFAAKLPLEELEAQHAQELKKLEEMCPDIDANSLDKEQCPNENNYAPIEIWTAMIPEIIKTVTEVMNADEIEEEEDGEDKLEDDASLNDAISEVAEALISNKTYRAVKLLEEALEKFAEAEVFGYKPKEHSSKKYEDLFDEELTEKELRHLVVLERIFLSVKKMEQKENGVEKVDKDSGADEEKEKEDKKKDDEANSEINKQKVLVTYLKDSVKFAKLIHQGMPVVCQLLGSKQVSDVMEAISFFVTAFEFGVLDAMTGVRKMLSLVWSKEKEVKAAVVSAYQRLYITTDAQNERAQALQIVENLSSLITGATLGERTSLEEIVSQFVSTGDISKHCITLLWERFTKNLPDTTDQEAHTALILLAMCANSEQSIISSNIGVLASSGLGERGEKDFALVKETCGALLKLAVTKPKTDAPTPPFRLDRDHFIFEQLSKILIEGLTVLQDRQYSPMAIEAVSTIYSLAEHPDLICGEVIQKMCQVILEPPNSEAQVESNSKDVTVGVSAGVLSRLFTVVGHVATRQLFHLDTYIFSEMKRRSNLKEEMEVKKIKSKKRRNKRKSLATSASEVSRGSPEVDIDEEMGLTGAVADDMEAEYIRSVCETEILNAENLLGVIKPLIWAVCSNPGKYSDPELLTAATLALAKYMMVSSKLCEDNLQLLFTILEKSEEAVIRANTVIALGDLYFRFPNQLEPWTPRLYARLRDNSSKVRQNTLTILTHLVLNDMVKVKGQISDIALCINDKDPRISGLANLFFNELARKGNALYNVLPDIISRLSDTEIGIEEDYFRKIIGQILSLIQKEKHQENLVEKLCHRFQATINVRQWRDIAYCLSRLQFNEKSIKKLSENFNCYADKLHEPEVYEFIIGILASVQKTIKPEGKALIEELETRVVESHEKGVEDETAANKAVNAKSKLKTQSITQKNAARRNKGKRMHRYSSSDSGSDEESSSQQDLAHGSNKENVRQSTRISRSSARKQLKT